MSRSDGGFTIVEVLVAVVVAVIFIGSAAQAYIYLSRSLEWQKVHAAASSAANMNLTRYRYIKTLESVGFQCANHHTGNRFRRILTAANDTAIAPPGRSFVEQKIEAYTTPGRSCDGSNFVVLESTVRYKVHESSPNIEEAKQVIYAR